MDEVVSRNVLREGSYSHGRHRGRHAVEFVLVEPSHPGNVGSAARALQVMGFERLTVVNPRVAAVNRHRDARAFASGAFRVLDGCRIVATLEEAVADCRLAVAVSAAGREFAPPPESPREIAAAVRAFLHGFAAADAGQGMTVPCDPAAGLCEELQPVDAGRDAPPLIALVFGTERVGLSVAQAQLCRRLCSIDADPQYTSLNLAQAVQIMAYEVRAALLSNAPPPDAPFPGDELPARHAQVEAMIQHLERMLVTIGFLDPSNPKRLMPRLRRLFGRAAPSAKEIDILRGICNEVEQKVSSDQARQ